MTEKEFNEELVKRKLECEVEIIDMTRKFRIIVTKNKIIILDKYISFESARDDFIISLTLDELIKEIDKIVSH